MLEGEALRHGLETDLSTVQRRYADAEERLKARERTASMSVEEANRDFKRLEESKRILQARVSLHD